MHVRVVQTAREPRFIFCSHQYSFAYLRHSEKTFQGRCHHDNIRFCIVLYHIVLNSSIEIFFFVLCCIGCHSNNIRCVVPEPLATHGRWCGRLEDGRCWERRGGGVSRSGSCRTPYKWLCRTSAFRFCDSSWFRSKALSTLRSVRTENEWCMYINK